MEKAFGHYWRQTNTSFLLIIKSVLFQFWKRKGRRWPLGCQHTTIVSDRCQRIYEVQDYMQLHFMAVTRPIASVDERLGCICPSWSTVDEVKHSLIQDTRILEQEGRSVGDPYRIKRLETLHNRKTVSRACSSIANLSRRISWPLRSSYLNKCYRNCQSYFLKSVLTNANYISKMELLLCGRVQSTALVFVESMVFSCLKRGLSIWKDYMSRETEVDQSYNRSYQ